MAQSYSSPDGSQIFLPGSYPSYKVQSQSSGLATSGVLFLVGEADAGPAFSQEADLSQTFFAPTELSKVIAKYKSGNLVDAFRAAASPANDINISGSPSFIYCIKSNVGSQASASLLRSGLAAYGVLADKSFGQLGNMLYASVAEAVSEIGPDTGSVCYIPSPTAGSGSSLSLRVNGGAKQTIAIAALTAPSAVVTALNGLSGINATGGVNRGIIAGLSGPTLAAAFLGSTITITISTAWVVNPVVGDTLVIPATGTYGASANSCIIGAASANAGAYIVTAVSGTTIVATKKRDATSVSVVSPVNVSAAAIAAGATDVLCFSPIRIQNFTGIDRGLLAGLVGQQVQGAATGNVLTLTLASGQVWGSLPQPNDLVYIPSTTPAGISASGANLSGYRVTAATSGTGAGASTITMTNLDNTAPATFSLTSIAALTDIQCMRPALDGVAKSLEIYDNSSLYALANLFFDTAGNASTWLSSAGAPKVLTSSAELQAQLSVSRQSDSVSEILVAGGNVALQVGYKGTTATMTVTATALTTSVVGGSGSNLSLQLSSFRTIGDLASFINAQTGYVASVGTSLMGQLPVSQLDQGTFGICTDILTGAKPGRVKKDASDLFAALGNSAVVQLGLVAARAASGLPDAQSTTYLAGGAKGATLAANLTPMSLALSKLRGNFVVPLFSRDASFDVADGLTDPASDYTIAAIHATWSAHVSLMSKLKTRRHRQAFLSFRGAFADAKTAAQNVANARCSMTIQDVKALSASGAIKQFQPWMGAVLAAGMQAAGFYKSIVFKGIQASGALMADGSMTDQSDADLEAAVTNGILCAQRPDVGGLRWNTDQTTYAADGNFVYNSIQAIYAADTLSLSVASRMERAFVGQSVADVSASVALSYLKGIMSDMKRLKLIASSDDAPLGYKNAVIVINGNTMSVSLDVRLATSVLFIPIAFTVSAVTQTATQGP